MTTSIQTYKTAIVVAGARDLDGRTLNQLKSGDYSRVQYADLVICVSDTRHVCKDRHGARRDVSRREMRELLAKAEKVHRCRV